MPCQREPAFSKMWAQVHSEALLKSRLARLAHQVSDASLQQLPDFHQRVEMLKQLEYVAPDDTVLMKVRWKLYLYCHCCIFQISNVAAALIGRFNPGCFLEKFHIPTRQVASCSQL